MFQQIFTAFLLVTHLATSNTRELIGKKSKLVEPEDLEDKFNGHFSDPSAKAAMIKHIGDMAFFETPRTNKSTEGIKVKRNAITRRSALWPNARVPYEISSAFSESDRQVILEAMRHWEDNTCIRFNPRTTERYYIHFISGDGCYSFVGRLREFYQPQGVSLGPGCVYFRTAVHEIGHAIGFYHEHTRPDRDDYVTINAQNVREGRISNFRKAEVGETRTLGYGYDFASIMHYSTNSFGRTTIVAKDEGIVFGNAQELSPLDILKANTLYSCGATRPPISTFPKSAQPLSIPDGVTCGGVMETKSGSFQSPGYPNHLANQRCAWVIRVPQGYRIQLRFPGLNLEQSQGCSKDYIQVFTGQSLNPADGAYISRNARDGKFCSPSQIYSSSTVYDNTATIYYQTDGSNTGTGVPRGLRVDFSSIDINECSRFNRCHRCTNIDGSYLCQCNSGYYHSPAANTCFDYNECAYDNGGCEHICDNTGGSYFCKCRDGYFLDSDSHSCIENTPAPPVQPSTQPPPTCGGTLRTATGTLQTPNWPETYPFNFDCEWIINLPNPNSIIELTFVGAFGIAGKTIENCPKDYLNIYEANRLVHTICDLNQPAPIRTSSSVVRLLFHAGPSHGPLRKGFRISYQAVAPPTTPIPPPTRPPTLPPTTQPPPTQPPTLPPTTRPPTAICGGILTAGSGSLQTPNWPQTYPFNFQCEWTIQPVSTSCSIQITFNSRSFGIAGSLTTDGCTRDYLRIFNSNGAQISNICGLNPPSPITTTGTTRLLFNAGPSHGPLRTGVRVDYTIVCPTAPPSTTTATPQPTTQPPPTQPPTLPPTTQPTLPPSCPILSSIPQGTFSCGAFVDPRQSLTFGPATFPSGPITAPMSCYWHAIGPAGNTIRIRFEYFDIPANEACLSNQVVVYDGYGTGAPLLERVCGSKCGDYTVQGSSNFMTLQLRVTTPQNFRGFYAHFEVA